MKDQYDCVVIGDGPVGHAMATRVAAAGFDVLLVECECPKSVSLPVPLVAEPEATLERMPLKQIGQLTIAGNGAVSIHVPSANRQTRKISTKVVVEATRQPGLLGDHWSVGKPCRQKKQAAIWGHYRDVRRQSGERSKSTLLLPTSKSNSCFWFAPLTNDLTSIGVVGSHEYLLNGRGRAAQVFEDELVQCPTLADRLMNATLVGELHSISDFFCEFMSFVGDGWLVLQGAVADDAVSHSAEVCFTQCLAESAAQSIIAGLRAGDLSARQLGQWTESAGVNSLWGPNAVHPVTSRDSVPVSTAYDG